MTRLRYIVDRPRGPRGGNHDEPYAFKSRAAAAGSAAPVTGGRNRPAGRVYEIDLDIILPLDASIEEQFVWHERQTLHHASEMLRLRPFAETGAAPSLSSSDLARIREVVSEWSVEEDRLRRGGGATPAARRAYILLRDMWREGRLG